MKKRIYILVALLTFLCGVLVFFIRPLFVTVRLFELRGNIKYYKFQKIKVKGYFVPSKDELSYSYTLEDYKTKCFGDRVYCESLLTLDLPEELKGKESSLINEIIEKNNHLEKTDVSKGYYGAEVEVIGYVEEINSVFGSIPALKVEEIKQIAPTRFISTVNMSEIK